MNTDNLNFIIDKIAKNQPNESDVSTLKEALTIANNSQIAEQLGKYNVNIVDGKDINIGDFIFQQWDDEAIHRLFCIIRFGESIEPKIREKQDYYQDKIQEIENEGKEKSHQLETKYQEELKEIELRLFNTSRGIETEHRNNREQEIQKILANLKDSKNQLEKYLEQAEKDLSSATYGWQASEDANHSYCTKQVSSLTKELIDVRNRIQAFNQVGASDPSYGPVIPEIDTYFEHKAKELNNYIDNSKKQLNLNFTNDTNEINIDIENKSKKIEQDEREEIYELIDEKFSVITKKSLGELRNKQHLLGLEDEDVKSIEQLIIKQLYQRSLDKYEKEFLETFNQNNNLDEDNRNLLLHRQELLGIQILGFNWEDIVIVKRIISSINEKIEKEKCIDYISSQSFKNNYQKLRNLLASKQWKEANKETCLLLQLAGMEISNNSKNDKQSKKITEKHIKILDKLQIQIIDMLWSVYSNDKFSFKKQINIFKNANQEYNSFAETIGWKKQSLFIFNFLSWKSDDEIIFNTDAPEGHLPFWNHYIVNPRQFIMSLIELQL